jgi:hypothetical protein
MYMNIHVCISEQKPRSPLTPHSRHEKSLTQVSNFLTSFHSLLITPWQPATSPIVSHRSIHRSITMRSTQTLTHCLFRDCQYSGILVFRADLPLLIPLRHIIISTDYLSYFAEPSLASFDASPHGSPNNFGRTWRMKSHPRCKGRGPQCH